MGGRDVTGINVTVQLSRRQAEAVLRAGLNWGHGVRQSADLIEAERRLMAAVREALSDDRPEREA